MINILSYFLFFCNPLPAFSGRILFFVRMHKRTFLFLYKMLKGKLCRIETVGAGILPKDSDILSDARDAAHIRKRRASMGADFARKDNFYSDLACERRRADTETPGVEFTREEVGALVWERIRITSSEGERSIGRPMGRYYTLHLPENAADEEIRESATEELSAAILGLLEELPYFPSRVLVVGLGNGELTPDAVGVRVADRVHATMHLAAYDRRSFRALDCAEIAVLSPGVAAESGMDAGEVAEAVAEKIHPDAVIAVDALAAREKARLGRTIQLSDTGIFPGSGVGNRRRALSFETLGVPVIAVGVPTVIDARALAADTALSLGADADKVNKFLSSEEGKYFVTPKDIDEIVNNSAQIIANSVNAAVGVVI